MADYYVIPTTARPYSAARGALEEFRKEHLLSSEMTAIFISGVLGAVPDGWAKVDGEWVLLGVQTGGSS